MIAGHRVDIAAMMIGLALMKGSGSGNSCCGLW